MDSTTEDCYDIFNDYLGLSNVVGSHEDSVLLMKSFLLEHDRKNGSLSRDLALGLACDKEKETSTAIRSIFYTPDAQATCAQLSDVERLFGRGATLQKHETSPKEPKGGVRSSIRHATKPSISAYQQRFNNVSSNQHREKALPTQSANTPVNIHSALDAIIFKYNSMYERQKRQNVARCNDNQTNSTGGGASNWINIASLTAALAKVAASYDDQQRTISQLKSAQQLRQVPTTTHSSQLLTVNVESAASRFVGCSFCKNNKEVKEWFLSHQLKDSTGRVTCPVLRSYVCPLCDASGDSAHTIGHCPLNPDRRSSLPLAIRAKANATGKRKLP